MPTATALSRRSAVVLSLILLSAMPGCGGGAPVDTGTTDLSAPETPDLSSAPNDLKTIPDLAPACRKSSDCGGKTSSCCGGFCVDINADVKNCGACGLVCGAGSSCCAGSCADLTSDTSNCGSCGTACASIHSTSTCAASACALGPCQAGWGDCNMKPDDGCEANLRADVSNCAGCGKACALKNAIAGCSDGCYLRACMFGFDDCDGDPNTGCEASVLSDPKHCGSCANNCGKPPHATAGCALASCLITFCDMGYSDCNGVFKDGCETNTGTDAGNCGVCGTVCPMGLICKGSQCTCPNCNIPNASSKCVNQMCIFDKCNPGFADCNNNVKDGCEVNLTNDPANCGGCGAVCPKNMAVCLNSACTNSPCIGNAQWQRVTCTTTDWVWSRSRNQLTVADAATARVLATGCNHGLPQPALGLGQCSLDGAGWVSTQTFAMTDCDQNWYHLGGRYTGNCGGHNGDQWRHLVLTDNDCYPY